MDAGQPQETTMTDSPQPTGPANDRNPAQPPAMPRWVKVSAIVVGVLLLVFLILKLAGVGGQHGPARHQAGAATSGAAQLTAAQPAHVAARFDR